METIKEQLRVVRKKLFPEVTSVHSTLRGSYRITTDDPVTVKKEAVKETLKWLRIKSSEVFPQAVWDAKESFDSSQPNQPVTIIASEAPNYWICKLNDPDQEVPGRIWTTELSFSIHKKSVLIGLRQSVVTRESNFQYVPGIPLALKWLARKWPVLLDHRPLRLELAYFDEDIDELAALISDPARKFPVVVISHREGSSPLVQAEFLVKKSLGLAHVAQISEQAAFKLTQVFGKELSVFNGAIRTYLPGFELDPDTRFNHPIALTENVSQMGEDAFVGMLLRNIARSSVRIFQENDIPSFSLTKQKLLENKRLEAEQMGSNEAELLELAYEEIHEKDLKIKELQDHIAQLSEENFGLETRIENFVQKDVWLRTRIKELEERPEAGPEITIPDSYQDMESWIATHYSGKIVLTSKAKRCLKDAQYKDVVKVYKCIQLLGEEYWKIRKHGGDMEAFRDKCKQEQNISLDRTGSPHKLKEMGDEFFAAWDNRKFLLEWHLKDNTGTKEQSRCLRIYFAWDEETHQVVLGALPYHLKSHLS